MKAIINVRLYDYETYYEDGYVIFDEEIIECGPIEEFKGAPEVIDGMGRLLMPGLINFHTHIYSVFSRGYDFEAAPESFTEILEQIWWRMDRALTCEDLHWSTIAYGQESLKKGVVGIVDHNANGVIPGSTACIEGALKTLGMHGITCFETSDRFNIDDAIDENMAMIERTGGPFGMHASMTLSDETLELITNRIGKHSIHVHVSESIDDHEAYDETPIQRLDRFGLINRDSLLVHGVHMTGEDAEIIAKNGAVLAIATRSNLNNAVGTVDYSLIKEHGVQFVAGTDGLGVNVAASWQDIYYMAKLNSTGASGVELSDILEALKTGYRYYERLTGNKLGRFLPGYRFDAMLLDYEAITPMHLDNAFGHVFFGVFDALEITDLWVGGNQLIHERALVSHIPVESGRVENIWTRIGGDHVD